MELLQGSKRQSCIQAAITRICSCRHTRCQLRMFPAQLAGCLVRAQKHGRLPANRGLQEYQQTLHDRLQHHGELQDMLIQYSCMHDVCPYAAMVSDYEG